MNSAWLLQYDKLDQNLHTVIPIVNNQTWSLLFTMSSCSLKRLLNYASHGYTTACGLYIHASCTMFLATHICTKYNNLIGNAYTFPRRIHAMIRAATPVVRPITAAIPETAPKATSASGFSSQVSQRGLQILRFDVESRVQ